MEGGLVKVDPAVRETEYSTSSEVWAKPVLETTALSKSNSKKNSEEDEGEEELVLKKYQWFTPWLARHRRITLTIWGAVASFMTYYCMYAFRKPFKAATWTEEEDWLDGVMNYKTTVVLAQLIGYLISKWVAVVYVPFAIRTGVTYHLIALMTFAEVTLVLYGCLPKDWAPLAMLLNGLPLGCVWGLVVTFVEGRETSDLMLAFMSISFIISSGNVKDFGLMVLERGHCTLPDGTEVISPDTNDAIDCSDQFPCKASNSECVIHSGYANKYWMPAVVGAYFLPIFFFFIFMLYQIPAPSKEDVASKVKRKAMTLKEMGEFIRVLMPSVIPLWIGITLWTSYRDYRDTFQVEIFQEMGDDVVPGIFSMTETIVGLVCLVPVALMVFVKNNEIAVFLAHLLILMGSVVTAAVVFTYWARNDMPGILYVIMTGIGSYLAYTPYNSVLFERIIAYTGVNASVSFPMVVCDAVGYIGTFALFLISEFTERQAKFVNIFNYFGLGVVVITSTCMLLSASFYYFKYYRKVRRSDGYIEENA